MTLRAPDIKDEHGWQIVNEADQVVAWESSRDRARAAARNGASPVPDEREHLPAVVEADPLTLTAAQCDRAIKGSIKRMREEWVNLAAELYRFYKGEMWTLLGYESWRAYLADPDVTISEKWAYEHVAAYEQLVIERGVDPDRLKRLEPSNVMKVLPAVRRDVVTPEKALADVEALSRPDLVALYQGKFQPQKSRRGQPDTSSTIHTDSEPEWRRCAACGSRYRVDSETGERVDP